MSENRDCLSDFAIDRYLAGEHEDPASVEAVLQSCERCRERLEALRLDAQQVRATLPELPGAARRSYGWVGMLAVAAGLLLALSLAWAILPSDDAATVPPSERVAQTRTKGRARMTMYVRRGERVFTFDGETLQAGDGLAFAYTSADDTHLAMFDVEGTSVTLLHPAGATAQPVAAGVDVELALAVELDESVSEERIVAVFCEDAKPTAELATSLSRGASLPMGCSSDSIELRKAGAL